MELYSTESPMYYVEGRFWSTELDSCCTGFEEAINAALTINSNKEV